MNTHRGQYTFELEGKSYTVKFDWNAAAAFEDVVGGKILGDAMNEIARGRISAKSTRAMMWAGLQEKHPDVTIAEAGTMCSKLGRSKSMYILGVALRYFWPELPEPKTDPFAPDPPPNPPNPAPSP